MKYLFLIPVVFLSACSSKPMSHQIAEVILGEVFEKTTKKQVSYNAASCPDVRRKCPGGYQEWYQSNGKKACACNN